MIRPEWLATQQEDPLDPGQPIIDAHHHLYSRPGAHYLADAFLADLGSGHDVRATVFVQARSMLRADGPEVMKPVGETEFASSVAASCAHGGAGGVQVCAAIVGEADLRLGEDVRAVLSAHIAAGGGRFRGVRHIAAWDPDPLLVNPAYPTTEDMLESAEFRAGFAQLAPLGLSFDAWLLFPQLQKLTALARAFPQTTIVLNHCGGIVRIGRHAGHDEEVHARWSAALRELATCPNVVVKLGGLGMLLCGFGFETRARAPSSAELAAAWRPWMEHCIETFGPRRCMFESNFPADKVSYGYGIGWNAMKRVASGALADEKDDLFWRTAARVYRINV
jgi:predicted TIM-barrel fold metal-dependent hydrolase